MRVKLLNGIYTDQNSDIRTSYPKNMIPVPKPSGVSDGYLRPAEGIIASGAASPGAPRGGINWNGKCYRVAGTKLIREESNTVVSVIGDVGGGGQASLDYSFDYLGVTSGRRFYLYDGMATLTEVTDPDLGNVLDHIWVDGYFMLTDGEFIIVTDLSDPFAVNPLKYGSSEADPDPIKALLKLRNEPYALNRYTIEVFSNIGGAGFPFQRIDGAQIQKGTIGTHACCVFDDAVAFVGGGRNEASAVWLAAGGSARKISDREVEQILGSYSEYQLSEITVQERVFDGHHHLHINLPDRTIIYDARSSSAIGEPVWFVLSSGLQGFTQYRAKDFVYCYDKWLVADPQTSNLGYMDNSTASHWGSIVDWEVTTPIIYNENNGAIFHEIELVALTGRAELGVNSTLATRYSTDGETWSQYRFISAGKQGQRNKRLVWLSQGGMRKFRIQQFRGFSDSMLSLARLDIRLEALSR